MQENKEHLYGLYDAIAHGQIRRNSILHTCIVLIGLTRVGKSTVFNWINNKPLIGRQNDYGVTNYYLVNQNDSEAAELSDLPTSKTLIPNVYNVKTGTSNVNNETRIDTAGFKDKRSHVGVFSVNCMLNFIFEKGQNYKFVLVVSRDQLGQTGQALLDTLFHFINLFDYQNLKEETKNKLNSSVALLVTKAKLDAGEGDKIKKMLNGIIINCGKSAHRFQKKQICLKLLKDILESQRIQLFRAAQDHKNSPKCQIFRTFDVRGWSSFDLVEAKNRYPNILVNSFKNQFQGLDEQDKTQYLATIKDKIQSYRTAATIFADIISTTIQYIASPIIDYKPIFARMKEFNTRYDQYTEINTDIENRLQFNRMSFKRRGTNQLLKEDPIKTMVKIKAVVAFVAAIDELSHVEDSFIKVMEILRQVCDKIFSIIQDLCCRTTEQQNTLINFAYIVLRGLEEFKAITKVDHMHCESAHRNIKDYIISTSVRSIKQQKQSIIKNISQLKRQKKLALFPKLNELAEYIKFFQQFIQQYSYQIDQNLIDQLSHKKIEEKLCYCQLLLQEGVDYYPQALQSSINILQDIINYRQNLLRNTMNFQGATQKKKANELQNNFLNCFKIIGSILLKQHKYTLAINIFDVIEDCSSVIECYELQIQNLSKATHNSRGMDSAQLQLSYYNYSEYCSNHGRVEKGIELMQNYQRFVTDYTKIKKIKSKLTEFVRGREANYGKYQAQLQNQNGIFTIQEDNLRALIEQIKKVSVMELPMVANPTYKN